MRKQSWFDSLPIALQFVIVSILFAAATALVSWFGISGIPYILNEMK